MQVDVILPAGGRISNAFAAAAGEEIKALIPFNGQPILERTLNALRAGGRMQRAVVIGPPELAGHPAAQMADVVLPEAASGIANIMRGLEWLQQSDNGHHAERVLVVTTDLPFLTPAAINGFMDACPPDAVISVPIMTKEEVETRFPTLGGEYIKLRDGQWTMGCVFLVNPVAVLRNREHLERVYNARKSAAAMIRLLGPQFIIRFLCRQATVGDVQRRCEQILGYPGAAVLHCAPELAYDIDLPAEYEYAVRWLAQNHDGEAKTEEPRA